MCNCQKPPKGIEYYPFTPKWHRLRPHLTNPDFRAVLERDFNKFTYGTWHERFGPGQFPFEFESCDWASERRGRTPGYWRFVKHGACHWLVNANLKLAELAEPARLWRILTSDEHSTVWDGEKTLFDMNFSALRIPPEEAFALACGRELKPGEQLKVHLAEHYTRDQRHTREQRRIMKSQEAIA
jgi:hypothetical protein